MFAVGFVVVPSALASQAVTHTNSPGPLLWSVPGAVDSAPIDGIACPSKTRCIAVDRSGNVLWSTNPAGGPRAWHRANIDGTSELTGISCASVALCVAVDSVGNVLASTFPTAGGTWSVARVDTSTTQNNTDNAGAVLMRGVSCPSTTLCVAVDAAGNALVSTDPTGGASNWATIHIDTNTSYRCTGTGLACQPPLVGVSCPSAVRCIAIDFSGNLLSTSTPAVALPWVTTTTSGGALSSLWGISCVPSGFCATTNGPAGQAITFGAGAPTLQQYRSLPYSLYGIWCQSASLCLASVQTPGGISGLLGSFDPAAPASTWSLSSLGGVNAVACPARSSVCVAADDEGNVAAGETTRALTTALRRLLRPRRLPTIATLDRALTATFTFTPSITGQLTFTWTVGRGTKPLVLATTTQPITAPGRTRITIPLTAAGQRRFRAAHGRVGLTATATFATSTGSVSSTRKLSFRRPPRPPHARHAPHR